MEQLPVNAGFWLLAMTPIVLLLVLLAVFRWKAPEAGPVGLIVGAVIALVFFQMPFFTLAVSLAKGIWNSIPILYVIFPALLLYRIGTAAGAFSALRTGISRYSRDETFLVLGFGWVLASFLQGIAGFGAPIAVVAPLLVAIGVRPVFAVAIPLIGHAWANMFGTLAVGWLATLQVVDIADETATAVRTALLLWIVNLAAGLAIAWLVGRGKALRHALPMILIISVIHGGGQLALAFITPLLSTFLAATAALIALYPLSRWSRYRERADLGELPALKESAQEGGAEREDDEPEPVMGLGWALAPYGVLTVVAISTLIISPVEDFLERVSFGLPFPETTTGFGVVSEAAEAYQSFTPLTHPGTYLLVAALAAWLMYRRRGDFRRWNERADAPPILSSTASDAVPAGAAVVSFLVLAQVMQSSGMTDVLALGIAAVAPAVVFAALSNAIGVVGAFMTSSNTASNVLFAPLQESVAAEEELAQSTIIAAQSTGGAIGNAIAPANIVLGTSTTGATGKEGDVLRKTLPWAAGVAVLVGAATIPLA